MNGMSQDSNGASGLGGRLLDSVQNLLGAAGERAASALSEKVERAVDRLAERIGGPGNPAGDAVAQGIQKVKAGEPLTDAVRDVARTAGKQQLKQAFGAGGRTGGKGLKVTNIVESVDVGAPVQVVYNQWTQFEDFPTFMKKVEHIEQESTETLTWKAQILWSHRSWQSRIIEQVPDERIVWRSQGDKGSVDGTVSFHDVTPDLTRILVVLEYHPQGFFERTGNLWRAQGRRVRLELKHFVRHVMTQTVLDPDAVQGWRGEIREGRVVQDDETARREEGSARPGAGSARPSEDDQRPERESA